MLARSLILNSYPLARVGFTEDNWKSKNFIFRINGTVVFSKVEEGGKKFTDDLNGLMEKIKGVIEI